MSAFLLDVNVLIALAWPTHVFHDQVQRWFSTHAAQGWATCPITECGFLRIVSNPAFSPHALTPVEAIELLCKNVQHAKHHFWPDDLNSGDTLREMAASLNGHRQITDAYLIALCIRHKGKLATLDQGILELSGRTKSAIEFIK